MEKTGDPGAPTSKGKNPITANVNGISEILPYQDMFVVVDTASYFMFIGRLVEVSERFLILEDADVHDRRESPSSNEKYVVESKKYGVRINRKRVHIRFDEVVCLSRLDDVIEY